MKYVKTFEQVKDFYISDSKSIIVSVDEKYVVFTYPDHNRYYLFDISILDEHFGIFSMNKSQIDIIINWNKQMVDEFNSPKTHIIEIDQKLKEAFGKSKRDVYDTLIWTPSRIKEPVNIPLKGMDFDIGAQSKNQKLNL